MRAALVGHAGGTSTEMRQEKEDVHPPSDPARWAAWTVWRSTDIALMRGRTPLWRRSKGLEGTPAPRAPPFRPIHGGDAG